MVRCEEFYRQFEKKGNFCGKSNVVVRKVETYIDYVKRNRIGTYKISNCALDPLMSIEFLKDGNVHRIALRELKSLIKKKKISPEKITRRISIEFINSANNQVGDTSKLDSIPGIRKRMGEHEHDIGDIGYETRNMFDTLKRDIGIRSNDQALKIMVEMCCKDLDGAKRVKEMVSQEKRIEIVKQT